MNTITTKTLFFLLTFLCTTAIFHSCVKDEIFLDKPSSQVNGNIEHFNPSIPDKLITTSIFGLVIDENENPVSNSEVQLKTIHGFQSTTTDHNGNFLFSKVIVFQNNTLLKVHQTGKMPAFRKMSVTKNSYNYTKIKLLDKTIIGSLPSTQGGTLQDLSSPAKIDLATNSVRHEDGSEYSGNVEVAMSWIDPTAEDLAERMVGDLSGIDKDGKPVALGTFGMLNVELIGENGEALQLKEGTTATLSFPVPDELLTQAPPTIPLWSFDEELGTWMEEGAAILQDGFYVGKVSHFSSWNVDWKGERITLNGKVLVRTNDEDLEVSYLQVHVTIESGRIVGGYLDDSGEFEFYNFPANTTFILSIGGDCEGDGVGILWEEELGSFAEDTDLGTIVVQPPSNEDENFVTIYGLGVDCHGNALTDAYVWFTTYNTPTYYYPIAEDGTFAVTANNTCNESTSFIGITETADTPSGGIAQAIDISTSPVVIGEPLALESAGTVDITVSGTGIDCDGNPIENGYVLFEANDKQSITTPLKEDGSFEFVVDVCNQLEGEITLTDLENSKSSTPQVINLTTDSPNVLNSITACDELESFVEVQLDGENWIQYLYHQKYTSSLNQTMSFYFSQYDINNINPVTTEVFTILGMGQNIGISQDITIYQGNGVAVDGEWLDIQPIYTWESATVEITEYSENSGDIIRGTFYQEDIDPETGEISYPVSGTFKVTVP